MNVVVGSISFSNQTLPKSLFQNTHATQRPIVSQKATCQNIAPTVISNAESLAQPQKRRGRPRKIDTDTTTLANKRNAVLQNKENQIPSISNRRIATASDFVSPTPVSNISMVPLSAIKSGNISHLLFI